MNNLNFIVRVTTTMLFLLFVSSCGGSGDDTTPRSPQPTAQNTRILGMDVKEIPAVSFDTAYNAASALGVREVSVSLDWNLLEPTVGNYDDTLPDIIDLFYPAQVGDLTLVIRPLDTPGTRYPSDLAGNFDDVAVITAFENFLIHLHSRLTTLNSSGKLRWIQVGNEIDAVLASDSTRWAQWKIFFDAAKSKIEALWPDVAVSSVIQFNALKDQATLTQYLTLLPSLDSAVLTYYPLNSDFTARKTSTVATDFDLMVSTIPGKKIFLQECGYPSSSINLSSEALQADFITAVFKAWDSNSTRINIVDFSWQYDISDAEASQFVSDFGLSGSPDENRFKNYLASIGLSNHDATEKLALQRLRDELLARQWKQ